MNKPQRDGVSPKQTPSQTFTCYLFCLYNIACECQLIFSPAIIYSFFYLHSSILYSWERWAKRHEINIVHALITTIQEASVSLLINSAVKHDLISFFQYLSLVHVLDLVGRSNWIPREKKDAGIGRKKPIFSPWIETQTLYALILLLQQFRCNSSLRFSTGMF